MIAESSPNAIGASIGWIEAAMTGSLATAIATIAVASLGLMLLSGSLSRRRGVQLILGCFIIFGAPATAKGILRWLNEAQSMTTGERSHAPVTVAPPPPPRQLPTQAYDPYAGAALPPPR
jgi:type IV secretion system protein VirB2